MRKDWTFRFIVVLTKFNVRTVWIVSDVRKFFKSKNIPQTYLVALHLRKCKRENIAAWLYPKAHHITKKSKVNF